MNDPRFDAVRAALAAIPADARRPDVSPAPTHQAAVAAVLRGAPDGLELLLIKRAHHPDDPWSGHMALPGGRRDAADSGLLATAVRETLEETGVRLPAGTGVDPAGDGGLLLGRLAGVTPRSERLPRLRIVPFVFGIAADTPARVASSEVERVHWVSLDDLRAPDTAGTVEIDMPGGSRRPFPCFCVAGDIVWGLTYRILTDLLARLPAVLPAAH